MDYLEIPHKWKPKHKVGRLEIGLLQSLIAVSESKSLSQGAQKLNIPQPTMSLQLKRLEERSGRALFKPGGRGKPVRLSRHGERLVEYAKRILLIYDEATLYLSSPDLTGEVRVGIPEWFAESGLNEVLARFKEIYRDVQIKLVAAPSNRLRAHIISGELDVCVSITGDGLEPAGQIWREPLHWVANRDLRCLKRELLPVGLFSEPCPFRNHVIRHLGSLGRLWREEYVSDSVATIRTAVVAGLAVSAFPAGAITSELTIIDDRPGFAPLPPVELAIHQSTQRKNMPELNTLVEHLSEFISRKMKVLEERNSQLV